MHCVSLVRTILRDERSIQPSASKSRWSRLPCNESDSQEIVRTMNVSERSEAIDPQRETGGY